MRKSAFECVPISEDAQVSEQQDDRHVDGAHVDGILFVRLIFIFRYPIFVICVCV